MIDTVKIMITNYKIEDYSIFTEYRYNYIKDFFSDPCTKDFCLKSKLKKEKQKYYKLKIFLICNTYIHAIYNYPQMYIEFSVPKLLFGNNLQEVSESDFGDVVNKLVNILRELNIVVSKQTIENACIRTKIHLSKNFVLDTSLTTEKVQRLVALTYYSKRMKVYNYIYDKKFIKFHSKSLSILFYDKLEEMKQHNATAPNFADINSMAENRILRIEIQFKQRYGINNTLSKIIYGKKEYRFKFKEVFSEDISKKVFDYILRKLNKNLPDIILDGHEEEELKEIYGNKTNDITRRIAILKCQKDSGSYEEGIKKAIEIYGENFVKKNKCILVDNEKLKFIFLLLLQEMEKYKPLFHEK